MEQRLLALFTEMEACLGLYRPEEVAVEELFWGRNTSTAITVGQARGVVLLAAARQGLPVYEYTPLQVKQAVVGYGRADKRQVQFMIRALLALPEAPKPDDTADALAVAVCHAHSRRPARA
jgi:crossover junction endodeoxyribonuclease RuvC